MSNARDEKAKAKMAAYFRTPEGRTYEARVAAWNAQRKTRITEEKARQKMVKAWRKRGKP